MNLQPDSRVQSKRIALTGIAMPAAASQDDERDEQQAGGVRGGCTVNEVNTPSMRSVEVGSLASQYVASGWSLVPIPSGTKGPRHDDWNMPDQCITDQNIAAQIAGGVGLAHAYSKTCCIDLDDLANCTVWLLDKHGIDVQALLKAPDAVQIVSGRDNRAKLLYRLPDGCEPLLTHNVVECGLELRCATSNGKTVQDVLPPSIHPITKRPYRWAGKGHWRDLPVLPTELLAVWQTLTAGSAGTGQVSNQLSEEDIALIPPQTIHDLRSALLFMKADDRNLWQRNGHRLKTLGKVGRGLFMEWSATSDKFNPKDAAKKWDSFKPTHTSYQAIFKEAQDMGWLNPAKHAGNSEQRRRELQREESRRIGEGSEFDPLPEIMDVDAMLDRRIFLSDGSRVFDVMYPAHTLAFADFKNATAASYTDEPTGTFGSDGKPKFTRIPNSVLWLRHAGRRSAVSATFKAGDGLFVSDPNGRHCVNLWNGFNRVVDGSAGKPAIFLDHVRLLFKDRADDFLDWLAHIEQRPGELPHTAWLHISSHTGTGRNAMAAMLAKVFAGYAAMAVDLVHLLESGFNERLSRKVIAVCDEIREGGAGQWKHAEALKQMITASARNINTKYGRQSLEHNACRFLMFSNHRSAIPLDDTDRRIEVVIFDDEPRDADYYSKLYAAVSDPVFIASIAKFLRDRDLSRFNPGRHALKSAAKEQVIATSRSPALSGLLEFNESYSLELVVSGRLEYAAGLSGYSSDARKLLYAAQEAGWEKLGRRRYNGRRETLYVRREYFAKWSCEGVLFTSHLPKVDGGDVDWKPGSGGDEFDALV